jgi:mono/diheme cytochrome c family protein
VKPAAIVDADLAQLLDNLKLPEYRTRYRTRRELRGRDPEKVLSALKRWVGELEETSPHYEHHLVEAMWVGWGMDKIDLNLLKRLFTAKDFRARAAAVRAVRYNRHQIPKSNALLHQAAQDTHGRVRLEAIVAASWLAPKEGLPIVQEAAKKNIDTWIQPFYETALKHLKGETVQTEQWSTPKTTLTGTARKLYLQGAEIYRREGHCITCHQENGQGLPAAQFPPLAESEWVSGDRNRLIKLTLHGLLGPIKVKGVAYQGLVPMTPFKGLSNEELASVLTYVRNSFGNEASSIQPEHVEAIRKATRDQKGFLRSEDL